MLMVTVKNPVTYPEFIDRYLVSAEAYSIPATLLINKIDLYGTEENQKVKAWKEIYSSTFLFITESAVFTVRNNAIESIDENLK